MTAREAYEEDVRRCPNYPKDVCGGGRRPTWDELSDWGKESWRRNPTPREYPAKESTD